MLKKEKLQASSLSEVPEVNILLERLGLGTLDAGTVDAFPGRNNNWAGHTTSGERVFVKRLDGDRDDSLTRFRRVLDLQSLISHHSRDTLRCPPLLGVDEESRLLVFEWLENGRAGNDLATKGEFDADLAYRAGQSVGALHQLPAAIDGSPHPLPPVWALHAIPLTMFSAARVAELHYWTLLQKDRPLIAALETLREREQSQIELKPCHGDLRLDQFLLDADQLYMLDWEESRIADPARDVGAFAGEWLYHAIRKINSDVDKFHGPDTTLSHDLIVERGSVEIAQVRPLISAFWQGYRDSSVPIDSGLAERATSFAGWHLLDRLLATAGMQTRLRPVDLAAAGIGRTALLAPARFTATMGLAA
ncbi:class V lanthionine synthetase subunit LxmK [Streptosporangium sp. NPDC087985]|uniref:class V lanthionine synthetase subunit LxmK n=1 Tax=Streptosporangium sp. NPDC087985 TaxID=3366196 RepID=UPI0037F89F17